MSARAMRYLFLFLRTSRAVKEAQNSSGEAETVCILCTRKRAEIKKANLRPAKILRVSQPWNIFFCSSKPFERSMKHKNRVVKQTETGCILVGNTTLRHNGWSICLVHTPDSQFLILNCIRHFNKLNTLYACNGARRPSASLMIV